MSKRDLDELNHISELDFIPEAETYEQYMDSITNEQAGMSKEEVFRRMLQTNESAIDLDALPAPRHNWVDRGLLLSCEGAGHANHHARKFRRR